MKLKLVKQGEFLGTTCDFYVDEEDNIYMSRTQIGYSLQYKQPQNAITIIHKRYPELLNEKSIELDRVNLTPSPKYLRNDEKVHMYNERGIYTIVRKSNQAVADQYFDWVYDTIQSIKKNGYYIATEKDNRWLGIRQESKKVRNMETDVIQQFIEYAKQQGSKNADRYYSIFTKLVNSKLMLESGERDSVSQETLMEIKGLETIIQMYIKTLLKQELPYKKIYQEIKNLVSKL